MVLAIDIGNTNIDFALMDKRGRVCSRYTMPAGKFNLSAIFDKIKKRNKTDKIIVVSVAPDALKKVKSALKKNFAGVSTIVVGENAKVPLKSAYRKNEVGQDRLITAFAAKTLYGLPVLIIDFGTAVTFDAVSENGEYLGGLILPGVKMSLESLHERTAMLPKTHLKKTHSFIGKDTHSSIRNGMIYGYAAMCDGLITLFRKKLGKHLKIVATGGDSALISRYTQSVKKVDPTLSLKGLHLLS